MSVLAFSQPQKSPPPEAACRAATAEACDARMPVPVGTPLRCWSGHALPHWRSRCQRSSIAAAAAVASVERSMEECQRHLVANHRGVVKARPGRPQRACETPRNAGPVAARISALRRLTRRAFAAQRATCPCRAGRRICFAARPSCMPSPPPIPDEALAGQARMPNCGMHYMLAVAPSPLRSAWHMRGSGPHGAIRSLRTATSAASRT